MKLTKHILKELDSEESNLGKVRDHIVFRAPKHSKDLYIAMNVVHAQSGLRYVQVFQLPLNVARGLAIDVSAHAELDNVSGPDF